MVCVLEDVVGLVVGWRLDGQQVKHGVEDVVLLEYLGQFTLGGRLLVRCGFVLAESVGGPYEEWYLILHLRRQAHGQAMHEHLVLAE